METTRRPRDSVAEAGALAACGRTAAHSGIPVEALGWFDRALAVLVTEPACEMLVDVLRWKGTAHRECGDTSAADRLYVESGSLAEQIGYPAGAAHAANCRGIVAQRRGRLAEAERLFAVAASLAEQSGAAPLSVMVERNLGIVASIRGEWDAAVRRFEASQRHAEAMGDSDGLTRALNNIAIVYIRQSKYADAEALFDRVLALVRAGGDLVGECICEFNRAELFIAARRLAEAAGACEKGLGIADARGDRLRRAEGLRLMATISRLRDADMAGEAMLAEALALADAGEDPCLHAEILRERAHLHLARGEVQAARQCLRTAHHAFTTAGARPQLGDVMRELAALPMAV